MNPWSESPQPGPSQRQVLSVRQVNDAISEAIDQAFPRTIWVKGEVQRFPADAARRKHLYFELQETGGTGAAEYQVAVALMGWDRQRFGLGRFVDGTDPDLQIANKLEVCLECKVDFYAKFGKISLKIVGVDRTFSLGKLEARRREILAYLKQQGLLERNARVPLPDLPLKVGLITSPGSAAHHDFMTGLETSGWAFKVLLQGARMQGEMLQSEVINAVGEQIAAGVDVIVITRGGGSRADLSWFDQRELAVCIAECPLPVITAIGHEIDTSIADLVAHHRCKTPTAAAEFLVAIIDGAARRLDDAAAGLVDLVQGRLEAARRRLQVADHLPARVDRILLGIRLRLKDSPRRLERAVHQHLEVAGHQLGSQSDRLHREVPLALHQAAQQLRSLEEKSRLLDPARLLARGYSLTLDSRGKIIRSASEVAVGDHLETRLADGRLSSIVQAGGGAAGLKKNLNKGKKRGGKQKETGQKSLFR